MDVKRDLIENSKKFNKIVLWGFKSRWHTHRFIFQSYYRTFKKLDIPVIWVDDEEKNKKIIEKGDLIFLASSMYGRMVPEKKSLADYHVPIRDDVFYVPHAENDFFLEKLRPEQYVHLKFYQNDSERFPKIYEAVHWDETTRTIYQPWGTDLLPEEFKKPTFNKHTFMFWVGSIWNDKNNHGNTTEIEKLKSALKGFGIRFIHVRFVPNFVNALLIRLSRIAPAIAGRFQTEISYLPDRMVKNISYGQLGFSNVRKFNDIFKDCHIYDEDTEVMIEKVLRLSKEEYIELVKRQQEICKNYTTLSHLNNIVGKFL